MQMKNCNAKEFIEGLNGRKVICFGASATLMDEEYNKLGIYNLEEHVAFFCR